MRRPVGQNYVFELSKYKILGRVSNEFENADEDIVCRIYNSITGYYGLIFLICGRLLMARN